MALRMLPTSGVCPLRCCASFAIPPCPGEYFCTSSYENSTDYSISSLVFQQVSHSCLSERDSRGCNPECLKKVVRDLHSSMHNLTSSRASSSSSSPFLKVCLSTVFKTWAMQLLWVQLDRADWTFWAWSMTKTSLSISDCVRPKSFSCLIISVFMFAPVFGWFGKAQVQITRLLNFQFSSMQCSVIHV